jgi:hypothetical protein
MRADWTEPRDYSVLDDGDIVGRILLSPVAPQNRPWMWASWHNGKMRRAAHGYEATREVAIAAFARSWRISEATS